MLISYVFLWFQATVDVEVKTLLSLKADYKAATGQDWKPGCVVPVTEPTKEKSPSPPSIMADSADAKDLKAKVDAQGNKVRELKAGGADKVIMDFCV